MQFTFLVSWYVSHIFHPHALCVGDTWNTDFRRRLLDKGFIPLHNQLASQLRLDGRWCETAERSWGLLLQDGFSQAGRQAIIPRFLYLLWSTGGYAYLTWAPLLSAGSQHKGMGRCRLSLSALPTDQLSSSVQQAAQPPELLDSCMLVATTTVWNRRDNEGGDRRRPTKA